MTAHKNRIIYEVKVFETDDHLNVINSMGGCNSTEHVDPKLPSRAPGVRIGKKDDKFSLETSFENKEKISKVYNIELQPLGSGAFGEVRKAVHKSSGDVRAIKMIYKTQVSSIEQKKIMKEIEILEKMDHPNIIKIYEYFQDSKYIYIVMECVSGGELFTKIQELKKFSEATAAQIFHQLIITLNYLHSQGVVHRDIKPENIMLDENGNMKLIDFGSARDFEPGLKLKSLHGTPYYVAPEVINSGYDEKCDIWSSGVILYILLTGIPPFNGFTDEEIMKATREGKVNMNIPQLKSVSDSAKDLIVKMLTKNYKERPSAKDLIDHPWFKVAPHENNAPISPSVLKNISKFESKNQLQRAIYFFMINNVVSKADKQELTEVFNKLDKNMDGVISRQELEDAFQKIDIPGISSSDIDNLIKNIDSDHSDSINYTEFLGAALDRTKAINKERIRKVFEMFDSDGNGKISPSEFKQIFKGAAGVDETMWQNMINEVDKDGNSEIDFDEFEAMLMKMAKD